MIEKTILCPRCKKKTVYSQANSSRPFCSERCQNIDVAAWADEKFYIPDTETQIRDEE